MTEATVYLARHGMHVTVVCGETWPFSVSPGSPRSC